MAIMGKRQGRTLLFLFVLMLAVQVCILPAAADDEELQKQLPGVWEISIDTEDQAGQAFLTLDENGDMALRYNSPDNECLYSYSGIWAFELVTDYSEEYGLRDRLTLCFSSADNSEYNANAYDVVCVYYAYSEEWVENDTRHTYLLLEEESSSAVSPLEEITGEEGTAALHREQGPNMKVVNCKNYVSLREERSKKSARIMKVPPGALVLGFPEEGDENGFIRCVYHDEYGYILAEYLQLIE